MSIRHGRAKQYGSEPPESVYTKPPPPVHGNNTYNGRAHHNYQQQQQQQHQQFYGAQQQLLQQQHQFYEAQQQQSNVVGGVVRPISGNHHLHHSLPRNAWSVDRHSLAAGGSSSNSSNERVYATNRRSKHRVYNSHRQSSSRRALHHQGAGGGATTDPDALSSVTTAGAKYGRQQQYHQSQHHLQQLHQLNQNHRPSSELPSSSVVAALPPPPPQQPQGAASQYQLPPLLPPQNSASAAAATVVNRQPVTTAGLPTAASTGGGGLALRHHPQHHAPSSTLLQFPSCDVAVDACGGHCPRFENFCHFCLLVFYFVGITVGFLLILAAVVSSRDPRYMYIGGLVLPVSMFLMAVQCRVRRDANRRKRHRQLLNGRLYHRSNNATAVTTISSNHGAGQQNAVTCAPETIPLQNIMVAGSAGVDTATLRRQFHGNVYQCVDQVDEESNYDGHHYETASDVQQIEGVPWWRREDNRSYGRTNHH